jgi:lysozyme
MNRKAENEPHAADTCKIRESGRAADAAHQHLGCYTSGGDTLSRIAQSYETTTSSLIALNTQITNANVIVEGTTICVSATEAPPEPYRTSYTVALGDSLEVLAERFGITLRDLVRANGIGNPNLIVEGESIAVPPPPAATPAP